MKNEEKFAKLKIITNMGIYLYPIWWDETCV